MKVQRIRERDATSGDWGGDWRTWLRVSRQDIKSLKIEVTSESRMDDEYIYLRYGGADADAQTFYRAMMERGAYYQQYGWHEGSKDKDGLDLNFVELGGDRQTFEWAEGRSPIRDLESVA